MKVKIKNIGIIKQAEFEIGKLTIITGNNNTGKTYATYALYGFIDYWFTAYIIQVRDKMIEELKTKGVVEEDITCYLNKAQEILADACHNYSHNIYKVFATSKDNFKDSIFDMQINTEYLQEQVYKAKFEATMKTAKGSIFSITKSINSYVVVLTLLTKDDTINIPKEVIVRAFSDAIKSILFGEFIVRPFMASAERTGAAIFKRELNFARNRLLDEIIPKDKEINPLDLLLKVKPDYPLPVEEDVNFARQLESYISESSEIMNTRPDIIEEFQDLLGGVFKIRKNEEIHFVPTGKHFKLSLDTSSSAVRSLLDLSFYLRHIAQKNDFIMIDEPELNLHPSNQRRIARLFAKLINFGIKILITTHSDYIIRELNTLIMLNNTYPRLQAIMTKYKYDNDELLNSSDVKVYISGKHSMRCDGASKKTQCYTLMPTQVDPKFGIIVNSFDETINEMNTIQDEIIWGGSLDG